MGDALIWRVVPNPEPALARMWGYDETRIAQDVLGEDAPAPSAGYVLGFARVGPLLNWWRRCWAEDDVAPTHYDDVGFSVCAYRARECPGTVWFRRRGAAVLARFVPAANEARFPTALLMSAPDARDLTRAAEAVLDRRRKRLPTPHDLTEIAP
ncbi:hypothetical protein [Phenylobacterium sp.]|uniref:hypothetical protein n=1 Tax=Phenylobacterium sp. TaxID=1871053 RepID=UPI00261D3780|nr:hypothetical protein [Phenylobacterium sp.]